MDGLKLAAAVRDRLPPVKIIVMSGKHRPRIDELPMEARFISKPVDPKRADESRRGLVTTIRPQMHCAKFARLAFGRSATSGDSRYFSPPLADRRTSGVPVPNHCDYECGLSRLNTACGSRLVINCTCEPQLRCRQIACRDH